MRVILAVAFVLALYSSALADQRLVCDPAKNDRVVFILGPTDPAPPAPLVTITVLDAAAIPGIDINKYRCNGAVLELRPAAELELEFPDEYLKKIQAQIDAATMNDATIKAILKVVVKRIIDLENEVRKTRQ